MIIDVTRVQQDVVKYLRELEFEARDADGNDFQHGADQSLRFKVGTSYKEVSIQVVYGRENPRNHVIRVLRDTQMNQVREHIHQIVVQHWQENPV